MKSIHPFPARMAPEIALKHLDKLKAGSVVCDPMTGSGTVAALATRRGFKAIAFDIDPLATLITLVRCSSLPAVQRVPVLWSHMRSYMNRGGLVALPWIDDCEATAKYIEFWYGPKQIPYLRRAARFLAYSEYARADPETSNILRLCLSRIVVQKTNGASLAWDVSHSRPHRVYDPLTYEFDVGGELEKSVQRVYKHLLNDPANETCTVRIGDGRVLSGVFDDSVDAILSSPPYLNAIDYLRGHRLSLVWLGLQVGEVRDIRAASVGAENKGSATLVTDTEKVFAEYDARGLSVVQRAMVLRYSNDLMMATKRAYDVLRSEGIATYVIGNNVVRGCELRNSDALIRAMRIAGFKKFQVTRRSIPANKRYLPVAVSGTNALNQRMVEEIVISAKKPGK